MANPHYRITIDYGRGASPRTYDYARNEGFEALAEALDQTAKALDNSLSPVAITITNLGKIAERDALDRIAAAKRDGDAAQPENGKA